jgi:hypothetical protein
MGLGFYCLFVVLVIKPKASHMLGKFSTAELYPQPQVLLFNAYCSGLDLKCFQKQCVGDPFSKVELLGGPGLFRR